MQSAEGCPQGTFEPLEPLENGAPEPSIRTFQRSRLLEPSSNFLAVLPAPQQSNLVGLDHFISDGQSPLYMIDNDQSAGLWHEAVQTQDPYGAAGSYQPETVLAGPGLVMGMDPVMDENYLTSLQQGPATDSSWSYDYTQQSSHVYPPQSQASFANTDDSLDIITTRPQNLQPIPFLKTLSPSLGPSDIVSYSSASTPAEQECPLTPLPGRAQKPRSKCTQPGCTVTLSRPNDLGRHIRAVHLRRRCYCSVRNCANNKGQGFSRFDKIKGHMKTHHAETFSHGGM
jgi:hypothetical protein